MNVAEGPWSGGAVRPPRHPDERVYPSLTPSDLAGFGTGGTLQGTDATAKNFCRHCGKPTLSATHVLNVGDVSYEVVYCSECGIASSGFRLARDGSREGPADNLVLRRLHKPEKK